MSAVDEIDGTIVSPQHRSYREVAKGYTTFRNNDVLFAKITPCMENGKAALARQLTNGLGFGSTEFHVLRATARIDSEYLYHFVRQPEFRRQAKAHFTGTAGQQRVPTSFLKNYRVPLPPIWEQRRIADILNRAAGVRRLRQEAQEKTRQVTASLFTEMFGNPLGNPDRWPKTTLSEVSEIRSGITKGRKPKGKLLSHPYLRVANVQDGHLNLIEIKNIEITEEELNRYHLENGDLLMTEGGDADKLGRAALWRGELENCIHQNHVFRVRINRTVLLPEFLRALANSIYGKTYFSRIAKRTTGIASINKTQLGAFPVVCPPLPLQQAFIERVADIQAIIVQQEQSTAYAEALCKSLMANLLAS